MYALCVSDVSMMTTRAYIGDMCAFLGCVCVCIALLRSCVHVLCVFVICGARLCVCLCLCDCFGPVCVGCVFVPVDCVWVLDVCLCESFLCLCGGVLGVCVCVIPMFGYVLGCVCSVFVSYAGVVCVQGVCL